MVNYILITFLSVLLISDSPTCGGSWGQKKQSLQDCPTGADYAQGTIGSPCSFMPRVPAPYPDPCPRPHMS